MGNLINRNPKKEDLVWDTEDEEQSGDEEEGQGRHPDNPAILSGEKYKETEEIEHR